MSKEKLDRILTESPLLPALVAIFIVVATFANNAHALEWGQIWVSLVIAIIPGLVVWLILWLIKDLRFISATGSAVVTAIVLLYSPIPKVYYHGLMPVLIMIASIGLLALLHKHVKKGLPFVTIALVVCIMSSLVLAQYNMVKNTESKAYASVVVESNADLPNIYLVIPDRFTSHEALLECGYDNSGFIAQLRSRGFYVRDNSLSTDPSELGMKHIKTTRTLRFLASVFSDGEEIPLDIDYNIASQKVKHSSTIQKYLALGYELHNIGSWYPETKTSPLATRNYVYDSTSLSDIIYSNMFTTAMIERSVWRYLYIAPFISEISHRTTERNRQIYQFETIKSLAGGGNKFVFMHLLAPHPPFAWTANGELQTNTELGTIELFVEQTKYIEVLLIDMIDYIQQHDSNAIIILQADEGMCFSGDSITNELSNTQFNGILTAWKLPVDNNLLDNIDPREILKYTREVITQ